MTRFNSLSLFLFLALAACGGTASCTPKYIPPPQPQPAPVPTPAPIPIPIPPTPTPVSSVTVEALRSIPLGSTEALLLEKLGPPTRSRRIVDDPDGKVLTYKFGGPEPMNTRFAYVHIHSGLVVEINLR